jgi:hypothetical protein
VLDSLATDPKAQRRGAGSMLVKWGVDMADSMNGEVQYFIFHNTLVEIALIMLIRRPIWKLLKWDDQYMRSLGFVSWIHLMLHPI